MTDIKKEIEHFKEVLERFGNDTVVRCSECGRTQYLQFENGLINGWSKCCNGLTMPIIYHQADVSKAMFNIMKPTIDSLSKLLGEKGNEN